MASAGTLGSLLLATEVAGNLYEKEVRPQDDHVCYGQRCFHTTFLVTAGSCMAAALLAQVLARRSRRRYELLRQQLREQQEYAEVMSDSGE